MAKNQGAARVGGRPRTTTAVDRESPATTKTKTPTTRPPSPLICSDDDLPPPPPNADEPRMPLTAAHAAQRQESAAIAALGERFEALAECLLWFDAEVGVALNALAGAIPAGEERVGPLREMLAWSRATAVDLRVEARAAAAGRRLIDGHQALGDAIRTVEETHPALRVIAAPDAVRRPIRAHIAKLTEAFYLAIALVAERIGKSGTIRVETELRDNIAVYRISGLGGPRRLRAGAAIGRLRSLVGDHGGRIRPGRLGASGAELEIELPAG